MDGLQFQLRYATRVLELQARFWRKIDTTIRIFSFLSGTAAFAAIVSSHSWLTLFFGVIFALLQAVEFVVSPSSHALEAKESGKLYKAVQASNVRKDKDLLEQALLDARKQDEVTVFDSLRHIAYNDVVKEIGHPEDSFDLTRWQRLVALMS
jgi:hypothetical protein